MEKTISITGWDCVIIIAGLFVGFIIISYFFAWLKLRHRRNLRFRLVKSCSSESIEKAFLILRKLRSKDLTELVEIGQKEGSVSFQTLNTTLWQRFKKEIQTFASFSPLCQLIAELPDDLYKVIYQEFLNACKEESTKFWAQMYASASEENCSSMFFIDQVVLSFEKEKQLKIYEETYKELQLNLMARYEDDPLNYEKEDLTNLADDFKVRALEIEKSI